MKKYINGKLENVLTEKEHEQICSNKNLVEISKVSTTGNITIKYIYCPKCGKYILGKKIDSNEYY